MDLLHEKYQLIELVSQSDQSLVYRALETRTGRYVAYKTLSLARTFDEKAIAQFQQEMQLLANLTHPHIVPVYDYGQTEDNLYLVTPFISSGSLSANLARFASLQIAQQLISLVAEALQYVHQQGLLHGNLKPSNILLGESGQPLLIDFGVFQKMGTLGRGSPYQSPEQACGGPVDRRIDVFGLGVLLFEMLTGGPPTPGTIPPLRQKRSDLPVAVEQVVTKALAADPAERIQTAREFSDALKVRR